MRSYYSSYYSPYSYYDYSDYYGYYDSYSPYSYGYGYGSYYNGYGYGNSYGGSNSWWNSGWGYGQDADPLASAIVLDLNGDGAIGMGAGGSSWSSWSSWSYWGSWSSGGTAWFDMDGDGWSEKVKWLDGMGDGLLVDNRDGMAETDMNGTRLFGNEGDTYASGHAKLMTFDMDGNGSLTGDELAGIAVWVDDGDAMVETGEIQTLDEHGITAIATEAATSIDDSWRLHTQSSATLTDDSTIVAEDVRLGNASGYSSLGTMLCNEATLDAMLEKLVGTSTATSVQDQLQEFVDENYGNVAELLRKVVDALATA